MIFHKIYNIYIHTCEKLIRSLIEKPRPVNKALDDLSLPKDLNDPFKELLDTNEIKDQLTSLIEEANNGSIKAMPEYCLTMLEKQWLKSISVDPRSKLFDLSIPGLEDIEPLYNPNDYVCFDRPVKADPWSDTTYIKHFKTIYHAFKEEKRLALLWRSHEKAGWLKNVNIPEWAICKPIRMEYDARFDAMFLYAECERKYTECKYRNKQKDRTKLIRIPMHSISLCRLADGSECEEIWRPRFLVLEGNGTRLTALEEERTALRPSNIDRPRKNCLAELWIKDNANALSRTLASFCGYQKKDLVCLSDTDKTYCLTFCYDRRLDTEDIVENLLSLGSNVHVKSPNILVENFKQRWKAQRELTQRAQYPLLHTNSNIEYSHQHESFENMRPFIMKVIVTRPNTEVRVICMNCTEAYHQDTAEHVSGESSILYEADCDGDGIYENSCLTHDLTHVFEKPGVYTIAIRGNIGRILLRDGKHGECDTAEITNYLPDADDYYWSEVSQWGDISWQSMAYMFAGACVIRIRATDAPDLSHVKDMEGMFYNCINMNDRIEHWDVSHIISMKNMFARAEDFNQPLERWNISNVTNMANMFAFASSFNQPLNKWNVEKTTDMSNMFKMAEAFNQPLDSWDVSHVKLMNNMFCGAVTFNQNLDSWNIAELNSSNNMFAGAVSLKSLPNWRKQNGI